MSLVQTRAICLCLGLAFTTVACAHLDTQAPARDGYDNGYLVMRAEQEGCAVKDRKDCCEKVNQRLAKARAGNDMREVETALDVLAVSCPAYRREALQALSHRPPEPPTGGIVNLSYAVALGPDARLYWMGAYLDGGRVSPRTRVAPGTHTLEVEAHVMTGGSGKHELHKLTAEKAITMAPHGKARVVLKRISDPQASTPFVLLLTDGGKGQEAAAPAAVGSPASADSRPAMVKNRKLEKLGEFRYPSELKNPGARVLSIVCADAAGKVQSIEPLNNTHPRYLASVLDALDDAKYKPHEVDGQAVQACTLASISFN